MTSIHDTTLFDTQSKIRVGTRPAGGTPLPVSDHRQLQRHLENCEQSRLPAWNLLAYVLRDKIMMTDPVSDFHASDLAVGGSLVTYSVGRGPEETGMSVGQRAPLLLDGGAIKSVRVLAVAPPA